MLRLPILALLAGCGAPPEPPAPPEPAAPAAPVPPPVERLAEAEECEPDDLLDRVADLPALERPPAAPMPEDRRAEYLEDRVRTVVELQPWRRSHAIGEDLVLTDLHPRFHRSLLLQVGDRTWHLENPRPNRVLVDLDKCDPDGLTIVHIGDEEVSRCTPWKGSPSELDAAAASGRPYVSICDDHLLVRNTVTGRRSTLEWATDFVRHNVSGGEHLTSLVKKSTQGRYRKQAAIADGEGGEDAAAGPAPIRLLPEKAHATVARKDLGLPVDAPSAVPAGTWLPVTGHPGVYASVIAPGLLARAEDEGNRARIGELDAAEREALAMFLAFDLAAFDLELEVGTEHPGVRWSERAAPDQVDPALPGPDGFDTLAPLGLAAQVPPLEAVRLEASFTGGFKREHAAFKSGELAKRNHASHYGVVQDGVVQSKLQPGLATLVVFAGGEVDIRTWSEADEAELDRVLHARQNGVPLLQEVDGKGVVSPLIASWQAGNWSGSSTGEARTIRAGACVQESERGRFLLYGYFTATTPRAMARAFLAAGCTDAIHLDMNALEHTYAAVYDRDENDAWTVHHLDRGMSVLDKTRKGVTLPRFVAFADNRDFFTVLRK